MEKNLQKIGFDKAEAQYFSRFYMQLEDTDKELLKRIGLEFSNGGGIEGYREDLPQKIEPLAEKYNVSVKSIYLLFLVSNFDLMRKKYLEKGISEEIFYETLKDLKYKLDECKKMYGVLGISPLSWYYYFMNAEMVALGRLQFHERKLFDNVYYTWNDISVTPEDTVVNIHIPSSGHFTREMRMDSYKKAFEFFGKKKGEYLVISCASWLLYPGYKEVFPEGSNLYDFIEDFDMVKEDKAQENTFPNAWQVFGMEYNGDTSIFPTDTTLQRNFIKFLNEGKCAGFGTGIIIFDGEKIVNNKRDAVN